MNVHTVSVISSECCPISLPVNDSVRRCWPVGTGVSRSPALGGAYSGMGHETTTAVIEDERVVALPAHCSPCG